MESLSGERELDSLQGDAPDHRRGSVGTMSLEAIMNLKTRRICMDILAIN